MRATFFTFATTALLSCMMVVSAPVQAAEAAIITHPLPAIYSASQVYALKANGKPVPIVDYNSQYNYAAFAASAGPCKLEVTRLDGQPIKTHSITPIKLKIAGVMSGSTLSFSINEPLYLILEIDDLRKLVIAIDPEETNKPPASGDGIFNVTAAPYLADLTGAKPATDAIQRAVNDAAIYAGKNGIVYVPDGVYRLAELKLLSSVSLYLEPGAVLRISGERDQLKVRYHKRSQNRDGTWFIYTADGATNVRIFGRGTIDGDGKRFEKEMNLTNHLVVPLNCTQFTMDGPILRDSGLWGTVVANSNHVTLKNTKHLNRLDLGENDCVDICNSQDVVVQRSIGISLDDPYSTKTWAPDTDLTRQWTGTFDANRNIVLDDCLAWTRCFAFKIGAGVWRDQENITIRNSVVFDSAHAIGISHSYGSADVRNVLFDSIDVERNTMNNLGSSWARIVIDQRKAGNGEGGGVHDVRIRNITVRDAGTIAGPIKGLSVEKAVRGVRFENIGMPASTGPALTLEDIGVSVDAFAQDIVIGKGER